ncbi:bifunctional 3'-5' exonuclease/DNA polymerase [Zhihengliuella sp.]|uniref:bifunctional 3'-5' exonuclease/DNA polymerase n=1 Tax=Zhihengliuella sp. TaxID=1954483 RepID=UPI0028124A8F|nr:bifunctional 3'-5' exonuclease/DNA polymerase [Zhihengliuella sp.]
MHASSGERPSYVVVAAWSAEPAPAPFDLRRLPEKEDAPAPRRDGPGAGEPLGAVLFLDARGRSMLPVQSFTFADLADLVTYCESRALRWVWESTRRWYALLLSDSHTVDRAWDVGLIRTILQRSPVTGRSAYAQALPPVVEHDDASVRDAEHADSRRAGLDARPGQDSLFAAPTPAATGPSVETVAEEFRAQHAAIPADVPGRKLELLATAETVGALIAAEIRATGMPWRADLHRALLEERLGPRPAPGHRPARLEEIANRLREQLDAPRLNPDSPQELLRALHRAGIDVRSTSQWELAEHDHPSLETLEQYKKLSRLFTANGWAWLEAWIHDGRFWPDYTVGGVVTGRWSARGGGALQIPATIRSAVHADYGSKLVVADAAQLEPRILAAMSGDEALAAASTGQDLYQGIANMGFGGDRSQAKLAMLGAMYGQTTGEAGRLMGQLSRTFGLAVALVEQAARDGEAGRIVTTFLGRGCPPPDAAFVAARRAANSVDATAADQARADSVARTRGRFTRNFVVQGTAAEWALCWLGQIRHGLRNRLPDLSSRIVFFLHDEVMLHVPNAQVDEVVAIVHEAAARATALVFRSDLVETPVTVAVVDSYDQAK